MTNYGCGYDHAAGLTCRRDRHTDGAHMSCIRTEIIWHFEWWTFEGDLYNGDPLTPIYYAWAPNEGDEEWKPNQFANAELLCFHDACDFWSPRVSPSMPKPERCEQSLMETGEFVALVSGKQWEIETFVKNVAFRSGQTVDWHPCKEWGQILCLGDVDKVVAASKAMLPHRFVHLVAMRGGAS